MPLLKKEIYDSVAIAVWEITESNEDLIKHFGNKKINLEKLHTLSHENRKKEWLACRSALAAIVDKKELFITYDQNNKPHLKNYSISFSHSKNYAVAIASTKYITAVDIELYSEKVKRIQSRFLSRKEQSEISDPEAVKELTLLWSAKESVFKYYSKGYLDFAKNIEIKNTPLKEKGILKAEITKERFVRKVEIFYEFHEKFVLTYIIHPHTC